MNVLIAPGWSSAAPIPLVAEAAAEAFGVVVAPGTGRAVVTVAGRAVVRRAPGDGDRSCLAVATGQLSVRTRPGSVPFVLSLHDCGHDRVELRLRPLEATVAGPGRVGVITRAGDEWWTLGLSVLDVIGKALLAADGARARMARHNHPAGARAHG